MKVNLWFARDQHNEIVSIVDSNNENTYTCPICSSKVIPKAVDSKKITPHYAHVDVDKCNSESMLHWWFKHKFIERGDTFKIKTDVEIEFTCKDLDTEVTFNLENGIYRPDLVIYTECGQEIIFEIANTNKKQVIDYIDRWIELDKVIVEVDIKSLQNVDEIKVFNALYYKGKCFNFNKRDGGYYNTIGKLKEQMKQADKYDIELVKKLDWFWNDVFKYNDNQLPLKNMVKKINSFKSIKEQDLIKSVLRSSYCNKLYKDYRVFQFKIESFKIKYKNKKEMLDSIESIKEQHKKIKLEYKLKETTKSITYYSKHSGLFSFTGTDYYEVYIQYCVKGDYKQRLLTNGFYEVLKSGVLLEG